ncbi:MULTISPECIES: transglutaminase-like cysteine peptidase [Halomonadaceae]|uniref:transglutaminase-like cysteine peptidase n=1 Tax=Halomonadaceae TaxID=28256 RepID=UPI001581515C|nr:MULTISPECIES: transglutaminase-like cysteine peptidase [Halomonas]MDI4636035.1 transglutaminase-like cysteine peptidase [Halomonas sp. BMC7]NUJ60401.1 transglutaminase-like cysteine peptidase [Halomonas taeanensis]
MARPLASPTFRRQRRQLLMGLGSLLAGACLGLSPQVAAAPDPARLRQVMQSRFGAEGTAALNDWLALIDRLQPLGIAAQLRGVNDFFNQRIRWLDDRAIWQQEDYWATPLETLGKGDGDCEDFTIAKYITLMQLGIPIERLRLIYVRASIGRGGLSQAHMVLGYYQLPGAEPQVLDNLVETIQPASERIDLTPVFSFNSNGLWAGGSSRSRADPVQRLSRWRNVLARMQEQGFL